MTGGITNYVLFGVSLITLLVARRKQDLLNYRSKYFLINLIYCLFVCIYLSSLRPNGGIFSIVFVSILIIKILSDIIRINNFNFIFFIAIVMLVATFSFTLSNLFDVKEYILANISLFSDEGGLFFGYPRDSLKRIISEIPEDGFFIFKAKAIIYTFMWKLTNFVSGIRDCYSIKDS